MADLLRPLVLAVAVVASSGCARVLEADPAVGAPGGPCSVDGRCASGLRCALGVCVTSDAPPRDAGGELLLDLPVDRGAADVAGEVPAATETSIDGSVLPIDSQNHAEALKIDLPIKPDTAPVDAPAPHDVQLVPDKQAPPDHSLAEATLPDLLILYDLTLKCSIWSSWNCTGLSTMDGGPEGCVAFCGSRTLSCTGPSCVCKESDTPGASCPLVNVSPGCDSCQQAFEQGCCKPTG